VTLLPSRSAICTQRQPSVASELWRSEGRNLWRVSGIIEGSASVRTTSRMSRPAQARLRNASARPWLSLSWAFLLTVAFAPARPVQAYAAEGARVTFSLDFPQSDPEHYQISVASDGHTRYECSARIAPDSEDRESYKTEFTLSDPTRVRIFDLAAQAHYFSGKIDSGNRKLAFTGAKKLVYSDGQNHNAADYNFSPSVPVQQLTTLFQNLATTLEYGRRLAHQYRYQKLALDDELRRMEDQARRGELAELQAVKPILQAIFDDASVINVVRARAQRIMEMSPILPSAP